MSKFDANNLAMAAKKYVNRKILLGSMALVSGIAMIVLFTFVPYTWKPERLTSNEFVTDLLIIIAITILGMVCLIFISQASNANNPASKISIAMVAFKEAKAQISDKHAFKQWIRKVQQPKDLREIKERILLSVGVDDFTILNLSDSEIKGLLHKAQRYDNVFYPALDERQVKTCIDVKKGVKVKFPVPEVYLSAKSILDDRTPSERLSNEGKKKRNYAMLSIVSKIGVAIIVSVIFTMFVKDLTEEMDALEAAGKFAVRMMNLFTSSFMGYIVGGQLNDIDAEYVDLRIEVFGDYLSDKDFQPKSVKEEAREQFIERVQEEQVLQIPAHSDDV